MIRTAPKICAGRLDPPFVNLVIVNRFGKQEAEGREIRQAIETAILLERARVTWASWEAFAGGEAEYRPCSLEAVLSWRSGVAARDRAGPRLVSSIHNLKISKPPPH